MKNILIGMAIGFLIAFCVLKIPAEIIIPLVGIVLFIVMALVIFAVYWLIFR